MLTAADLMTREVVSVRPEASLRQIADVLVERRIGGVPVIDEEGRLLGIVSEADLMTHEDVGGVRGTRWWVTIFADDSQLAREYCKRHGQRAQDVMERDVLTVAETTPASEIARLFERKGIKRAPVTRNGAVVGIVTRGDLLKALMNTAGSIGAHSSDADILKTLCDELQRQPWAHLTSINLAVEGGMVQLTGIVRSTEERRGVEAAAAAVSGVRGIDDKLQVFERRLPDD